MRRRMVRLDLLVIGARPEKLRAQEEIPAAAAPAPLSEKERRVLQELTQRATIERLTPAEEYIRRRLLARKG